MKRLLTALLCLTVLMNTAVGTASAAMPQIGLPTLAENDGKFLGLGGVGLQTLTNPSKYFIGLSSGETNLSVDIFDGDLGSLWDNHDPLNVVKTQFFLYADPNRTGDPTGKQLIASKTSSDMADNAWRELFRGPVNQAARAYSGNYFYLLLVQWDDPAKSANEFNAFKIRSEGQLSITPGDWSFVGAPINVGIDPAFGTSANTYGGAWDWYVYVPPELSTVRLTECDADARTADPVGQPPDDAATPVAGIDAKQRVTIPPDVRYSVFGPNGQLVINEPVPSGNTVCKTRSTNAIAGGGLYRWNWLGVDAHNLVFVHLDYETASSSSFVPLSPGTAPTPATTATPPPAQGGGAPAPRPTWVVPLTSLETIPATVTPTPVPPTPTPTLVPTAVPTVVVRPPVATQLPRTGGPAPELLLVLAGGAAALIAARARRR